MYIRADTVDDAMRRAYRHLLTSRQAIKPSRGPAVEIAAAVLHLTNPRARLSRTESRGRLFSALGEFLWYLAKTDDLAFIRYYIPDYQNFSDDGKTIHGAYGPRLFNDGGIDQVANIIALLRDRADSRRAVIQLFKSTDIPYPYKDVPCTCSVRRSTAMEHERFAGGPVLRPVGPPGDANPRLARIKVGDYSLATDLLGDPCLPPVILLHGIPGWRGTWRPMAQLLATRAHIVAPDLAGFGESSAAPAKFLGRPPRSSRSEARRCRRRHDHKHR